MAIKPILFSTPMVRALLEGRKTQTRRICKHQYWSYHEIINVNKNQCYIDSDTRPKYCVGEIIWVRETHFAYGWWIAEGSKKRFIDFTFDGHKYMFPDNPPENILTGRERIIGYYKRPSLFMPKAAARIFLKVTNVRVERLQDISEEDAIAEGIIKGEGLIKGDTLYYDYETDLYQLTNAKASFKSLWNSINGSGSLEANPWVWVYEFEKIEKPAISKGS